jgi:hypothetical protein
VLASFFKLYIIPRYEEHQKGEWKTTLQLDIANPYVEWKEERQKSHVDVDSSDRALHP